MAPQPEASAVLAGYEVEEQVGFQLRRAHQRHAAIFQAGMATLDLTPTQFTALIKTVEFPRVTQNQLGRHTAMDPATIQGVVRRLVDRGLVRRELDPLDRRMSVLLPTADGLALAARSVGSARDITEATLAPLGAAERGQLVALLRKLG